MNLLAIESATTVCGVAIFLNGELTELDEVNQARVHGKRLPVIVNKLLSVHSISIKKLDGIAISSGPGSYTGLRIGMSLAKGLAAAGHIPIIPVPTLFAMNTAIHHVGIYWVLLHSHKNMVYAQRYHSGKPDSDVECVEFRLDRHTPLYGFNLDILCEDYVPTSPSANLVGKLALQYYYDWRETDLNQIRPNYITHFNLKKV